jgi:hypothetical protein
MHLFVQAMEMLQYSATWANNQDDVLVPDGDRDAFKSFLNDAERECLKLGFNVSAFLLSGAIVRFSSKDLWKLTYKDTEEEFKALQRAIHAELRVGLFLQVPASSGDYYDDKPQFGEAVTTKFSKTVTDIQESAKCFATGRYTACVFHLMRVMENATQYLGKRLNVSLVGEKNWHNILEEVDKAIKALPVTSSYQKGRRNRFSEASAHLRMVKDAWRNDVMHPKETYTEEEAERVFRNVKDFMVHLATKL